MPPHCRTLTASVPGNIVACTSKYEGPVRDQTDIQVLIGSTREGRLGGPIGSWFHQLASQRDDIEVELIDLEEWDLPVFSSPIPPASGRYTSDIQRRWGDKVAEADGYVIVSAEYNHGYPAAIKNALDYVFAEWGYKPFAFVGYGNTGGARSVEQLRQVVVELNAVPIRNQLAIMAPWERIADGKF